MLRLTAFAERVRSSLFYVPMLFVIGGLLLGQGGIWLDTRLDAADVSLPVPLTSTVASARAVLSTIAGATITVAGIAFSVSLLIIQLASSQFSPRVVHGLFRDPFNKRVMGIVVGTFTYCLFVLRAVRSPLEEGGTAVIPNLSVAVSVLLGVVAILSIVAFINHSAHSMDVSQILQTVTDEAIEQVERVWSDDSHAIAAVDPPQAWDQPGLRVDCPMHGWVQQVDRSGLLAAAPPGGTVRLDIGIGHYAIRGTALCTIWPEPDDPDAAIDRVHRSIVFGQTRTMTQDVAYGIRQIADVALKALSPGINDPTTAQDAIFHLGAVLGEMLIRTPRPRAITGDDGRVLLIPHESDHVAVVGLAFNEIRLVSVSQPAVCVYLLEVLSTLTDLVDHRGLSQRAAALRRQADLIRDGARAADLLPEDRDSVLRAHAKRFGADSALVGD